MKKSLKLIGIMALAVIIGFSLASCGDMWPGGEVTTDILVPITVSQDAVRGAVGVVSAPTTLITLTLDRPIHSGVTISRPADYEDYIKFVSGFESDGLIQIGAEEVNYMNYQGVIFGDPKKSDDGKTVTISVDATNWNTNLRYNRGFYVDIQILSSDRFVFEPARAWVFDRTTEQIPRALIDATISKGFGRTELALLFDGPISSLTHSDIRVTRLGEILEFNGTPRRQDNVWYFPVRMLASGTFTVEMLADDYRPYYFEQPSLRSITEGYADNEPAIFNPSFSIVEPSIQSDYTNTAAAVRPVFTVSLDISSSFGNSEIITTGAAPNEVNVVWYEGVGADSTQLLSTVNTDTFKGEQIYTAVVKFRAANGFKFDDVLSNTFGSVTVNGRLLDKTGATVDYNERDLIGDLTKTGVYKIDDQNVTVIFVFAPTDPWQVQFTPPAQYLINLPQDGQDISSTVLNPNVIPFVRVISFIWFEGNSEDPIGNATYDINKNYRAEITLEALPGYDFYLLPSQGSITILDDSGASSGTTISRVGDGFKTIKLTRTLTPNP